MSNKTLKSSDAETALAPKASKPRNLWKYLFFVLLAFLVFLLTYFLYVNRSKTTETVRCVRYEVKENGKAGRCLLSLDLAQSPEEQALGLGGRPSLPQDKGLLFVFVRPGVQCFWMKDMQFPIDIIWMNSDKEIKHIEHNVSPNTYPRTFCPDVNAQYVLEVNAGVAGKLGMQQGQKLLF